MSTTANTVPSTTPEALPGHPVDARTFSPGDKEPKDLRMVTGHRTGTVYVISEYRYFWSPRSGGLIRDWAEVLYIEGTVTERPRNLVPMSDEDAAWIRANAWTKYHRNVHASNPKFYSTCACQSGPTGHCQRGNHHACQFRKDWTARPDSETHITRPDGTAFSDAEVWLDRRRIGLGGHVIPAHCAEVSLKHRTCAWRCPCDCHAERAEAIAESEVAAWVDRVDLVPGRGKAAAREDQFDLFAALT